SRDRGRHRREDQEESRPFSNGIPRGSTTDKIFIVGKCLELLEKEHPEAKEQDHSHDVENRECSFCHWPVEERALSVNDAVILGRSFIKKISVGPVKQVMICNQESHDHQYPCNR